VECRKSKRCDLGRVTKTPIGDDASSTPHHQPGNQNAASGRRTRIFPTINYKNCAGRTLLDSFALWVATISKRSERIEIFACGHVAKRERFTNHALFQRAQWVNILDELLT
jgi:hypothetical protein